MILKKGKTTAHIPEFVEHACFYSKSTSLSDWRAFLNRSVWMVVTPSCSFFWAASNSSISSWNLTIRTQVVPEVCSGCLHQWDHAFCFVSCLHYDMILTFCVTMAHWAAVFRKHQSSFLEVFPSSGSEVIDGHDHIPVHIRAHLPFSLLTHLGFQVV